MSHTSSIFYFMLISALVLTAATPAGSKEAGYQTGFIDWRAAENGFAAWELNGLVLAGDGSLRLDLGSAVSEQDPYPAGGYNAHNYYNGGSYLVGEAASPQVPVPFSFVEAIASWNAQTPPGAWVETLISAQVDGRWTKWYNLGIWAADTGTVERHSVNLQGDGDGYVAVDTLVLSGKKKVSATALQIKLRLFSTGGAIPSVSNASLAYSSSPPKKATLLPGNPALWNTALDVPTCSQMVYPGGGTVWCSPTSTSMVLGYWGVDPGPCEPRVRAAVDGVFDWLYDGHGNWPFNTAYAAARGMEAYVARFSSLAQLEPWIAAGVPVVMSYGWGKGELTNAPVSSSGGHLGVLVGFDEFGNPVMNDPAAASDLEVRRTYVREEFETLWLTRSGGTTYLIYPAGYEVPDL